MQPSLFQGVEQIGQLFVESAFPAKVNRTVERLGEAEQFQQRLPLGFELLVILGFQECDDSQGELLWLLDKAAAALVSDAGLEQRSA